MSNQPLSVNQALIKARTLARKGAPHQAAKIYQAVLQKFPGNKRAIEGLKSLERPRPDRKQTVPDTGPTQAQIDGLMALFERGRHREALERGTALAGRYPDVPLILNILGGLNAVMGRLDAAAASLTEALRLDPGYAEAHNSLGNVLSELGRPEQALASYTRALQINPDYAEAHNNLGKFLNDLGQHEQAAASYARALRLRPGYAEAHYNLGIALGEMGRFEQAVASYARALQSMPGFAEAHHNLANALGELGRHEQAVASYTRALRIKPGNARAHNNLANALINLGRHEAAIASYTEALRLDPGYAEAHCNLGNALGDLGKHEAAIASYTEALRIRPGYAKVYENLGRISKYQADDPRIARMRALLADPAISESDRIFLSFALGKAHDDIGETEAAFQHFLEGNRLRKKELGYDISSDKRLFGLIKSIFSEDEPPAIGKFDPAGEGNKHPIFIVGIHRSGTTLAEQILSSHSQVYGADEVHAMNRIVNPIVVGLDDGKLTRDMAGHIRAEYLSEVANLGAGEPRITDKMPLNFRWIGFILTAMPEARIVNLRRDPVATCWSVFKQYISNNTVGYAYDLVDIAEYYKLYIDLMDFWREKFPGRIFDLDYEALTENQEAETQKLLAYCGLDWEARCLAFHQTERAVRTPSSVQVRQAIYQGSSEAWRKYQTQLQPMIRALGG